VTDEAIGTAARAAGRAKGELERARDVRWGPGQSFLAGLFIGWAAVATKAALNEAIDGDSGYILLMAATVLAAWFGGLTGGLTASIVGVVLNAIVSLDVPTIPLDRVEGVRLALYLVVSVGTVLLIASRRAGRDRLADALDEVATLAEEVETRDDRLELMLAASGVGLWEWDVAEGRLWWSDAIFRHHGLEPTGQAPDFESYLDMLVPEDRKAFTDAVGAAVDGTARYDLEFRVRWPDGSIHWMQGAGRVFRDDDGNPTRMLGTGRDVTERRRLEEDRDRLLAEERRAGEFREAFIDVISHELRTPITTILGLTQILGRPGGSDDTERRTMLLEDVRAESERLHRLVEDLLVLSRVERGRLVVEAEPLEPRRLLERIAAHEAVELPTIDIVLDLADDLPIVAGESTYVEQIMRNLLGNAAKYTRRGTPVTVSARREGDEVVVRVSDEGPGIPEGTAERLFELFYRDPESARTVSGSGIGLFICASLVQAMGGRIWAHRRPEGGSEFGFTMHALEADDDLGGADRPVTDGRTASPLSARGL
jgi:PAS domain S-box-containing protein